MNEKKLIQEFCDDSKNIYKFDILSFSSKIKFYKNALKLKNGDNLANNVIDNVIDIVNRSERFKCNPINICITIKKDFNNLIKKDEFFTMKKCKRQCIINIQLLEKIGEYTNIEDLSKVLNTQYLIPHPIKLSKASKLSQEKRNRITYLEITNMKQLSNLTSDIIKRKFPNVKKLKINIKFTVRSDINIKKYRKEIERLFISLPSKIEEINFYNTPPSNLSLLPNTIKSILITNNRYVSLLNTTNTYIFNDSSGKSTLPNKLEKLYIDYYIENIILLTLPKSIKYLKLNTDLFTISIDTLIDNGDLINLESLSITSNKSHISKQFRQLRKLKSLEFTSTVAGRIKSLSYLPRNLKHFEYSVKSINKPKILSGLPTNLESLDINIEYAAFNIFQYIPRNLLYLSVSIDNLSNKSPSINLSNLPPNLVDFSFFQDTNNTIYTVEEIKSFPKNLQFLSLEIIDYKYNFTDLPKKLKRFYLRTGKGTYKREIIKLPKEIEYFEYLDINDNVLKIWGLEMQQDIDEHLKIYGITNIISEYL